MKASSGLKCSVRMTLLVLVVSLSFVPAGGQRSPYSKEEPVRLDFDMASIPEPNAGRTSSYAFDFLYGSFFYQVKKGFDIPGHAKHLAGKHKESDNVNILDEVPDSSWFINRNGRQRLTADQIEMGPNETDAAPKGVLTVVRGKTVGYQPGFWVVDERGITYLVKFDPLDYPELATAAEIIATKLFYAIGYNVPQNLIVRFRREQLRLDPDAPFLDEWARRRNMREADIDLILARVPREPDGSYRALASKFLKGKDKGSFSFEGIRSDDPNDIIPHENRRELRALRVFSAWLAHNDIRVANTKDFYVSEDGRQFLRHYLTDFGSALGSESYGPNPVVANTEFVVDYSEAAKSLFTFGIYQAPWRRHPTPVVYRSVGNYSADDFEPARWKQEFQLPAFEKMTDRDAYWAAKIVKSLTDEQIEAAVKAGEISDPQAAKHLARQIIGRRDKIALYYFRRLPALDEFAVEKRGDGFALKFRDLRTSLEEVNPTAAYEYQVTPAAARHEVLESGSVSSGEVVLPPGLMEKIAVCGKTSSDRGVARLALRRARESRVVNVYLYYDRDHRELRIVGIEQS